MARVKFKYEQFNILNNQNKLAIVILVINYLHINVDGESVTDTNINSTVIYDNVPFENKINTSAENYEAFTLREKYETGEISENWKIEEHLTKPSPHEITTSVSLTFDEEEFTTELSNEANINVDGTTEHNMNTTPEETIMATSTSGYRTSKVYDDGNSDGLLFKFWTTLSGNDKIEETTKKIQYTTDSTVTNSIYLDEGDSTQANLDVPMPIRYFTENENTEENQHEESTVDNIFYNDTDMDTNFMYAAEYGIMKMNELYGVQEPKLFHMGLVLERDEPARYVAAFNWQSEEAKNLSKYGYASLQAYTYLHNKFPDELESRTSVDENEEDNSSVEVENPIPPRPTPPKTSLLRQQCPLRNDPRCPPASKRYRTHDGTCNNLRRLRWGSALSAVQRFLPPEYGDGIQSVRRSVSGNLLPSARAISETVHTPNDDEEILEAPVTHMLMQWGQFLDHDITSSSQARGFNGSIPKCCESGGREFISPDFLHPECLPIVVPKDDSFYAPRGIKCLEFVRSSPAPRSGCEFGYREQLNQVTAYIDGSPVYSSSAKQSDKLRLFRNGLLQYGRVQTRKPVLPPDIDDEEELCHGGAVDASCFKAGDGRVNEHPGLVAMHIVWLRKHNRLATELSHLNPHWSDEKIYQETRKIVGALIQHITYREFLPIVLGNEVLKLFDLQLKEKGYYKGYSSKVNPNPANAFGAAAFRFGHSLVQDTFMRFDRFHHPIHNSVSLHNELTNPSNIWSFGAVDRLLLGLINQPSQKRDEYISPELTNHLFQTPRFSFGMDLASINIQRGRDHGLPPYVRWREPCGLSPILNWEDLIKIMPLRAIRNLQSVYRDVEDIDLFTGGMAERPVVGGLVGPTFACIIAQQFSNLKKGDRFWYENGGFESSFTPAQLQQIRKITLSQVLCQTMENVETLQPFAFLIVDNFRNKRLLCTDTRMTNFDLKLWTEGNIYFDNTISNTDHISRVKNSTILTNSVSQNDINGLLSDSFSDFNINNNEKPTKQPIDLNDKLDIPINSDSNLPQNEIPDKFTTKHITNTQSTIRAKFTTQSPVVLNDKLDFLLKNIKRNNKITKRNITIKRSTSVDTNITKNSTFQTNSFNTKTKHNEQTKSLSNKNLEQKTFPFNGQQIPFFNLLDGIISTPVTIKPVNKPSVTVYNQRIKTTTTTTKRPQKYTYLINIVPKTTTPRYENEEMVKITFQSDVARPSFNRRPVFNNNKLVYRPIAYTDETFEYTPTYNKPSNTVNKYDTVNNYAPIPTYIGSFDSNDNNQNNYYQSTTDRNSYIGSFDSNYNNQNNYYQSTTDRNSYGTSTLPNVVTTTKRYNIYQPVTSSNFYQESTFIKPIKPTHFQDSNYNSKPSNYQTTKPTNTGITIYIDNKVQIKPDNEHFTNTYNEQSDENDNIPLFIRPSYNKPLLQRPTSDYQNYKPIKNNNYSHNINTNNDNNHFLSWTQTPDAPHDFNNDYDTYTSYYKQKPQLNYKKTSKPPKVNINLASEYGNNQPNDIAIVINPVLEFKSDVRTSTTKRPTKYYYIRNVLYKYPLDTTNKADTLKNITNRKHEIIKENYNNPWKSNRESYDNKYSDYNDCVDDNEHKINNCNTDGNLNVKSNVSPALDLESKNIDDEVLDASDNERKDNILSSIINRKKIPLDRVFFDVIPSENSPFKWLYYKEKQENNSFPFIMPSIASDPLASKELPRPIRTTAKFTTLGHKKRISKQLFT